MALEVPPTAGLPLRWSDFSRRADVPLEKALAAFLDVDWLQVECSGTACLVIALTYLKSQSARRSVVVSGYTCPLVAIAVHQAGLTVKLCDSAPDSYDFSADALVAACDADTLAVIVTHFGGLSADIETAQRVARQSGAWLIEDVAQSLGARLHGVALGTIGDIGIFSLSAGKGLSIYQGGFMVARDKDMQAGLNREARRMVGLNITIELMRVLELIAYRVMYNPVGMKFVYGDPLRNQLRQGKRAQAVGDCFPLRTELCRVSNYRKSIAAVAIERLPDYHLQSRLRAHKRLLDFEQLAHVTAITEKTGALGTWPFITLLFDDSAGCERALARLWGSGLGVTKLFVHQLTGYDYLKPIVQSGSVPNAVDFAARTLTITNSHWLADDEFAYIIDTLVDSAAEPAT